MSPQELKRAWEAGLGTLPDDKLMPFTKEDVSEAPIPESAKSFLVEVGLPFSAAPFLSFGRENIGAWGMPNCLEIGFESSGDPIAIMPSGIVVSFNHDNKFAEEYISCSPAVLLETLIRYRDLIKNTQQINGDDAFLDGNIPEHLTDQFLEFLSTTDPKAADLQSMWGREIQCGKEMYEFISRNSAKRNAMRKLLPWNWLLWRNN